MEVEDLSRGRLASWDSPERGHPQMLAWLSQTNSRLWGPRTL